ncbi:MAG: hypothetical protein HFJ30_05290 [Clostridia bacterium]|nr:hypothetical protein [Clostridia bacterium]MCI9413484.1 hypothetical protein [Clostridia bacterium]
MGRYENFATKNAIGNYIPKQDADNYNEVISIENCQELVSSSTNTPAKNLGDFVSKTKENGGYYIAKYEASYKDNTHCYSKKSTSTRTSSSTELKNGMLWNCIEQSNAATVARNSFTSDYIESDLTNSYSWDTTIIFIQKYSEYLQYSDVLSNVFGWEFRNTGETNKVPDKVCNIYDMASNLAEWSSENSKSEEYPGICRGRTCWNNNI